MKDCNGKQLDVGDWVQLLKTEGIGHHSKTRRVWHGPAIWQIGFIGQNWLGECIFCQGTIAVCPVGSESRTCGCVLMKITPDTNQFENEHEKELTNV